MLNVCRNSENSKFGKFGKVHCQTYQNVVKFAKQLLGKNILFIKVKNNISEKLLPLPLIYSPDLDAVRDGLGLPRGPREDRHAVLEVLQVRAPEVQGLLLLGLRLVRLHRAGAA